MFLEQEQACECCMLRAGQGDRPLPWPQIEGLPTIVFIPKEAEKPALRTEGLLPCDQIVQIVNEL